MSLKNKWFSWAMIALNCSVLAIQSWHAGLFDELSLFLIGTLSMLLALEWGRYHVMAMANTSAAALKETELRQTYATEVIMAKMERRIDETKAIISRTRPSGQGHDTSLPVSRGGSNPGKVPGATI